METTLMRIAILAFTAFLAWVFKEPAYLMFLLMLAFTRKKQPRKNVTEEFDIVHERLNTISKIMEAQSQKPKDNV